MIFCVLALKKAVPFKFILKAVEHTENYVTVVLC